MKKKVVKKATTKKVAARKITKAVTANETEQVEVTNPEPVETPVEETDSEIAEKVKKGRNNDKYQFNGNFYGKGPLVRAIVMDFVAKNPKTTFKKLKEVFPDELLHRFGIFQEIDHARTFGARDRYFFKEEHQIKLSDKKVVVVCNQFTTANIQPFLKAAKALGFKIK